MQLSQYKKFKIVSLTLQDNIKRVAKLMQLFLLNYLISCSDRFNFTKWD